MYFHSSAAKMTVICVGSPVARTTGDHIVFASVLAA